MNIKTLLSCLMLSSLASCAQPDAHSHADASAGGSHEHPGPLGHRFDNPLEWAKKFDNPERAAWQKPVEVIKLMDISPGMTAVDLGAGTGYFLPYLSREVGPAGTVMALDIEPGMVQHMEERARREDLKNVRPGLVQVNDPRLGPASVHRILIVNTWHHISDRGAYAARLANALVPGGTVTIVDYTLESKKGPPRHERLPPEKVIAELRSGGLEAEAVAEDLPEQYIVVGKRS